MENNNSKKWYQKTWLVVVLIIFFFPIGLIALWKNSSINQAIKIIITVAVLCLFIASILVSPEDKSPEKSDIVKSDEKQGIDTIEYNSMSFNDSINMNLEKELSLINSFDPNDYRGDEQNLIKELAFFSVLAELIKDAEASKVDSLISKSKKLKGFLINKQIQEFPEIRQEYIKLIKDKLWEQDIYVTCTGNKCNVVNFTGGIFAANKNIKQFHEATSMLLYMLKFSQVRYRWYEGGNYTYYNLFLGRDSDLNKVIF